MLGSGHRQGLPSCRPNRVTYTSPVFGVVVTQLVIVPEWAPILTTPDGAYSPSLWSAKGNPDKRTAPDGEETEPTIGLPLTVTSLPILTYRPVAPPDMVIVPEAGTNAGVHVPSS